MAIMVQDEADRKETDAAWTFRTSLPAWIEEKIYEILIYRRIQR